MLSSGKQWGIHWDCVSKGLGGTVGRIPAQHCHTAPLPPGQQSRPDRNYLYFPSKGKLRMQKLCWLGFVRVIQRLVR